MLLVSFQEKEPSKASEKTIDAKSFINSYQCQREKPFQVDFKKIGKTLLLVLKYHTFKRIVPIVEPKKPWWL